ncbi:hypothetical protein ACOME3_002563 [Neoechinorhynchus agilis]
MARSLLFVLFLEIIKLAAHPPRSIEPEPTYTETEDGCFKYDVLIESLTNSSLNVDECGDPLRISSQFCFPFDLTVRVQGYLATATMCVEVDYVHYLGCEKYVQYSLDPNKAPKVVERPKITNKHIRRITSIFSKNLSRFISKNTSFISENAPKTITIDRKQRCIKINIYKMQPKLSFWTSVST